MFYNPITGQDDNRNHQSGKILECPVIAFAKNPEQAPDYCNQTELVDIPASIFSLCQAGAVAMVKGYCHFTVAYHLQQAVEKALKAFLECAGVPVPNTHDIDKLVRMSKNNGSCAVLTDWIVEKADMLTRWETDTRYDVDYCVEEKKVRAGLEEIGKFLELNGLKEDLREELQEPGAKENLVLCFPGKYRPDSDFEWNCMFQVFRKRTAGHIRK